MIVLLLALSSILTVIPTNAAHAETLGYPWPTDTEAPCKFGAAGGSSCTDPTPTSPTHINEGSYNWGVYDSNGVFQPFRNGGYQYRNCTDYAQWRITALGGSVPYNLHNGGQWYDNSPASKQSSTPQVGYAAVKPGNPGHVAVVEAVNTDGTITISEYNGSGTGFGRTRTGAAASMGFTQFVDFGATAVDGPVTASQPVSISPSNPHMYEPLTFSFTARANPNGAVSVKKFAVAVRAPDGSNQDIPCTNGTGVTLEPNQTWNCLATLSQGFGSQGAYTYWADWQDYENQWHVGQLGAQKTFNMGAPYVLTAVQPVSVGPAGQVTMYTPVNYSYRVKNTSGSVASIQKLVVAVRTAGGGNLDSTCVNGTGITLQPNEEWTCSVNLSQGYGSADTFTFWADWQDYSGNWHTGQLGNTSNTLMVTQAPTLSTTGSLSVGPTNNLAMNQQVYWSYRVKNTSGSWASIKKLIVAVRTPSGGNMDVPCDNGVNITLAPGEEWTCAAQNNSGYGSQGTFTFWADWQGYDNTWHTGALSGTLPMYVGPAKTLTTIDGINISPGNTAPKLTSLHWSYTVRNTTNGPVSVRQFLVAVIGPAGDGLNVGCANGGGVTLQPNETWTCQADLPTGYGSTGQFRYRADWQDYNMVWHTGELGPQYALTLY